MNELTGQLYPYQILRIAGIFFLIGVFVATFVSIPLLAVSVASVLGIVVIIGGIFLKKRVVIVVSLAILFLFLGIGRFLLTNINHQNSILVHQDKEISFKGEVFREPERLQDKQRISIQPQKYEGNILVTSKLYPEYTYGDVLAVKCKIQKPGVIEDFNYGNYLKTKNVDAVCYYPKEISVIENPGNKIIGSILALKQKVLSAINQALPEPHSSLLAGILVGARRSIPEGLLEDFNRVGLTHIIAISGYNITLIIRFVLILAPWVWINRRHAFWLMMPLIGVFVIFVGGQASVVRAALFGIIGALAYTIGRKQSIGNALLVTAAGMVAINPWILRYDAGFQLSFLATLGLIYIEPLFGRLRTGRFVFLREIATATLAATIATLPLILYIFGRLSVVSLFANLLILPAIPWVMALGAIITFVSVLIPFGYSVLSIVSFPVWLLLEYVIRIAEWLSAFVWASVSIEWFSWPWLIISYGLLGWILFAWHRKKNIKTFSILGCLIFLVSYTSVWK